MLLLGIICKDGAQVKEIAEMLYEYTHMKPHHKNQAAVEWQLPLLTIQVLTIGHSLGCRFDMAFYDEEIDEQDVKEIIYPCCYYFGAGKPRPLKEFLLRFLAWKNTITNA